MRQDELISLIGESYKKMYSDFGRAMPVLQWDELTLNYKQFLLIVVLETIEQKEAIHMHDFREHVRKLDDRLSSLEQSKGQSAEKAVSKKDIFVVKKDLGLHEVRAWLAWDNQKSASISDHRDFAEQICIGFLWDRYADEIAAHIQAQSISQDDSI